LDLLHILLAQSQLTPWLYEDYIKNILDVIFSKMNFGNGNWWCLIASIDMANQKMFGMSFDVTTPTAISSTNYFEASIPNSYSTPPWSSWIFSAGGMKNSESNLNGEITDYTIFSQYYNLRYPLTISDSSMIHFRSECYKFN